MNKEKADMLIYTTEDGLTKVETTFDGDTVWLSICLLYTSDAADEL